MPFPAIAAAAAIVPSIFGAIRGIGQRRQAKRIRASAVDPGYTLNEGVLQNAEIYGNRYSNGMLPGYSMQLNNINTNAATAFNRGVNGASSGGDVLDLATKIAYGQGQQQNQLITQNAQYKDNALQDFTQANAMAGQERQNANAYDRDNYMRKLDEAAALYGASDQNLNSAITGAGSIATTLALDPTQRQRRVRPTYPSNYYPTY